MRKPQLETRAELVMFAAEVKGTASRTAKPPNGTPTTPTETGLKSGDSPTAMKLDHPVALGDPVRGLSDGEERGVRGSPSLR